MLKRIVGVAKRLYRDEQGAIGLEHLLIIAAVVLPLLGVLIYYRNDIGNWVADKWEQYRGEGVTDVNTAPGYQP